MARSAFAHAISAFESSAEKNGHSRSISRSSSSPCSSIAASSALPSPNQAGSTIRACVHENTHGIARKSSMSRVCLALRRARAELQPRDLVDRRGGVEERLEGRDRRRRAPRYSVGRAARHLGHDRAVALEPRRVRARRRLERARPAPRCRSARARGGRSPASENFADSTSPCSVIFMRPATVPGGCAWIARLAGPPPRPTAPPRPWKNTQRRPWRSQLLGERDLRAVGRPAGGDVADVLVRVRVADHHLLLVADGAQRGAVDRQLQQRAHRRRRLLAASPRPRTAARSAAARPRRRPRRARSPSSAAAPRAGAPAPRCPTRRRTGPRRRGAREQLAERPERPDDLLRGG